MIKVERQFRSLIQTNLNSKTIKLDLLKIYSHFSKFGLIRLELHNSKSIYIYIYIYILKIIYLYENLNNEYEKILNNKKSKNKFIYIFKK